MSPGRPLPAGAVWNVPAGKWLLCQKQKLNLPQIVCTNAQTRTFNCWNLALRKNVRQVYPNSSLGPARCKAGRFERNPESNADTSGWRTHRASRTCTPGEVRILLIRTARFPQEGPREGERFLLTVRPISNIMSTKKSGWVSSCFRPQARPFRAPPSSTSCRRVSWLFAARVRS